MSTVTLATLKALAKDYADMTGSSFPVDARLNDYANAELANLRDLLIKCNEETLMKVQTITLSAGVSSYALASDFFKAVKVFLLDNGRRYPLKRFQLEEAAGYQTGAFAGTEVIAGSPFMLAIGTTFAVGSTTFSSALGNKALGIDGTTYTSFVTAGIIAGDKFRHVDPGASDLGADWAVEHTVLTVAAGSITFTPAVTASEGVTPVYCVFYRTTNAVSAGTGASIQSGTVELWYAPQLTRLTADTDVMPAQLPEGWEDYVALGMARRLLIREESPAAKEIGQLHAEQERRIISTASPRDMGEPDSFFADEGSRFAPRGHGALVEPLLFPYQRNLMYRIMNTVISFVEGT